MSEYGLKIKSIEAATLYEYNTGVRESYEYTNAIFSNSLLKDYLVDIGMNVWKEESTRDVICLKFGFGCCSFEEQIKRINKLMLDSIDDPIKLEKLANIKERAIANENKYEKLSNDELRHIYYKHGVDVEYITKNRNGNISNSEKIHYKMLYRSTGKAKDGQAIFIKDSLYEAALNYIRMGIKLPDLDAPIVEMSAYSSLIASTIIDKITINPKNILILEDVESFFERDVVSVETNHDKECRAKHIEKYKLKNILFDGQAIIEASICPEWFDGYALLRQHLFKSAAFKGHIQSFFKDYFGESYDIATVKDMFGNEHFVKDIQMITTDNSIKWLKFGVSYDYWCDWVGLNGNQFGIVKTSHKSKLGNVQKMSYQMVNCLDESIMEEAAKCSADYINSLKADTEVFIQYLKDNANFSNDFEALVALYEQNHDFARSEYFRERRYKITDAYIMNFKSGKLLQEAENLVIVGSPYAMLLHAVGEDVSKDDTFCCEDNVIQCYTKRFKFGENLACFRSPFNSKNNMGYLRNINSEKLDYYFDFGENVIAINLVKTDFQDRSNGSDQDSDSIYTTNHKIIVSLAEHCYKKYPTIVNNIPKEKNHYNNTPEDFARIDNNLASASRAIGESSNLAQLSLTYSYNFNDEKYYYYTCILSVLAQVAIDNAKRRYDIDINSEIKRIKKDMDIESIGYPSFWQYIKENFDNRKINSALRCPMNTLHKMKFKKNHSSSPTIPMSEFFIPQKAPKNRRKNKKVEDLITKYSLELYDSRTIKKDVDYILVKDDFDQMINEIKRIHISSNYTSLIAWLLDRCFCISTAAKQSNHLLKSNIGKNRALLIQTLYTVNKEALLQCFSGKPEIDDTPKVQCTCNLNQELNH